MDSVTKSPISCVINKFLIYSSFISNNKEIAYYHHEKWNGKGYPKGLKGEEIPLSARIVAIADVYDALTSKRIYKRPFSHQEAKEAMMLSSIFQTKFRRNFTVFYILSSILPLLILIFIIYKYVMPMLDETLINALNPIFTYGILTMLIPSILSIALGYQWIGAIEKLLREIKSKSMQIKGERPHFSKDRNELADIHEVFNELHGDLESKMGKLDEVTKQLLDLNIKLEKMATRDSLTTMYNRRYFDLKLIEEARIADRHKQELSLMMIDFDNFKTYNDLYGHQTGDKLLKEVAAIIKSCLRRSDMVFRYGGDEFAVLVPGCDVMKAEQISKKFVTKISETQFISSDGKSLDKITVSCGIAHYEGKLEDFIVAADKCLFAAKKAGKDCVVIS